MILKGFLVIVLMTRTAFGSVGIGTTSPVAGGGLTIAPAAVTTGTPSLFTITGPADTTLSASTEANDVNFNLGRTVQFSTGALTNQRAFYIQAPTYSFVGASTITNSATVDISGPPVAGTNATITHTASLVVESGLVGIGTKQPTATLDVTGQVHSGVYNASTSIDWNNGNVQYTSTACNGSATQFSFANMLEGGSYTLIVTGTATGSCNFTASTTVTPSSGFSGFSFNPANATPTATAVYTFLRANGIIYCSWISGFPAAS